MCAVAPTRQPRQAPGRASNVPARRPGYPLDVIVVLLLPITAALLRDTIIDDRTLSRLRSSADCEARDEALRSESQAGALTRLIRSRSAPGAQRRRRLRRCPRLSTQRPRSPRCEG